MTFPEDLHYTIGDAWVRLEGNVATIGITEFLTKELGDILYIEFPPVNGEFEENDTFSIEGENTVTDIFIPVGGKIIQVNESLNNDLDLINDDPYGKGWLIKVQVKEEELSHVMTYNDYRKKVGL